MLEPQSNTGDTLKPTLAILALLLFAGVSQADTIYDYVGAPFTILNGACTQNCGNLTGQLVVTQPLAPNTTYNLDSTFPASLTFTGLGIGMTVTPGSQDNFSAYFRFNSFITTDASGAIDQTFISVQGDGSYHNARVFINNTTAVQFPGQQFQGNLFQWSDSFDSNGSGVSLLQGTWTQEGAVATPEPSSILLLGSGLGLLALLSKKTLSA
jgi:hypothetical protein